MSTCNISGSTPVGRGMCEGEAGANGTVIPVWHAAILTHAAHRITTTWNSCHLVEVRRFHRRAWNVQTAVTVEAPLLA